MPRVRGSSLHPNSLLQRAPLGIRARANFVVAWLALAAVLLFVSLWVHGWVTRDPHAGLWGAFAAIWIAPFVPAFWLAGRAWARRWRAAPLMQLLPVLVLLGWLLVGW